ncbi:MAG: YggS family pyridoxal phosphate-dependent enzyme [Myxococcota bacterium]
MNDTLPSRLEAIRTRIRSACLRVGRDPAEVRLVAVSKRHRPEFIRAAYALGQRDFGENYVQEMVEKFDALRDLPDIRFCLIGHLQRNKVRDVVRIGASVHTVDSIRLAQRLARLSQEAGTCTEVFVQTKLSSEPQKSGCPPDRLDELVAQVRELSALDVRGLMVIPSAEEDPEAARPTFQRIRERAESLGLKDLSMGMSQDFEVAIEEGATVVRIGSSIFGSRPA